MARRKPLVCQYMENLSSAAFETYADIRRAAELRRKWAVEDAEQAEEPDGPRAVLAPSEKEGSAREDVLFQGSPIITPEAGAVQFSEQGAAQLVVNCLRECGRALARREILDRVPIPEVLWQAAISKLVASKQVERLGSKRGAKYFACPVDELDQTTAGTE